METNIDNNVTINEKEITTPVNLCDSNGKLLRSSIGWSRSPILNCNLKGRNLRKKKWNYWYMVSDSLFFSVTISNLDYIGMVFAYAYDFKTNNFIEKTVASPFGSGCTLPPNVQGDVQYKNKDMQVYFTNVGGNTHIQVFAKDFGGHTLSADLTVYYPQDHDTMSVVIPWDDNTFQFTSKHNCLPVEGNVKFMGNNYNYNSQMNFAGLDFGRGIWPYSIMWNWATASGIQEGHNIGLNFGSKWTDGTGMTENAFIVDGHITKLSEDIIFKYDPSNFMLPWQIKTSVSKSVLLTFTPVYKRVAQTNALILKSSVNQLIGKFNGKIILDSGLEIKIKDLVGCAEEHYAKW